MRKITVAAILILTALAGCGGGGSDNKTSKTATVAPGRDLRGLADCSTTWQTGAILPADYKGCVKPNGITADREVLRCLVRKDKSFAQYRDYYALTGEKIGHIPARYANDPDGGPGFTKVFEDCNGPQS